jgi:hypothetical protein
MNASRTSALARTCTNGAEAGTALAQGVPPTVSPAPLGTGPSWPAAPHRRAAAGQCWPTWHDWSGSGSRAPNRRGTKRSGSWPRRRRAAAGPLRGRRPTDNRLRLRDKPNGPARHRVDPSTQPSRPLAVGDGVTSPLLVVAATAALCRTLMRVTMPPWASVLSPPARDAIRPRPNAKSAPGIRRGAPRTSKKPVNSQELP